jgi:hypothetical protein
MGKVFLGFGFVSFKIYQDERDNITAFRDSYVDSSCCRIISTDIQDA